MLIVFSLLFGLRNLKNRSKLKLFGVLHILILSTSVESICESGKIEKALLKRLFVALTKCFPWCVFHSKRSIFASSI